MSRNSVVKVRTKGIAALGGIKVIELLQTIGENK